MHPKFIPTIPQTLVAAADAAKSLVSRVDEIAAAIRAKSGDHARLEGERKTVLSEIGELRADIALGKGKDSAPRKIAELTGKVALLATDVEGVQYVIDALVRRRITDNEEVLSVHDSIASEFDAFHASLQQLRRAAVLALLDGEGINVAEYCELGFAIETFSGRKVGFSYASAAMSIPNPDNGQVSFILDDGVALSHSKTADDYRNFRESWRRHPDLDTLDGQLLPLRSIARQVAGLAAEARTRLQLADAAAQPWLSELDKRIAARAAELASAPSAPSSFRSEAYESRSVVREFQHIRERDDAAAAKR